MSEVQELKYQARAVLAILDWPEARLRQFLQHLPIIAESMDERVRQDRKHGVQIRPPFEYAMILQEEVGEYQKEVTEGYYDGIEFKPALRAELVQVAAVALAALFSYDTREQHSARNPYAETDPLSPEEHLENERDARHSERMATADALHEEPAAAEEPRNLVAGLSAEIERVGKLREEYLGLPQGAGNMGAMLMNVSLNKGRAALQSGDIGEMASAYQDLQGHENG